MKKSQETEFYAVGYEEAGRAITARLSPEERAGLRAIAEREDRSVSSVIRRAIRREIEAEKKSC